ncbi:hypothetical protein BDW74DRAFT_183656 [Aspergillus multicolor]|uniref:uncharacterized protein n=1 Tax=Aspergillus multicolor TaxID=41759 RepID=UPI003CCD3E6F
MIVTNSSIKDLARFETTKRLLAQLVNEGFAVATTTSTPPQQIVLSSAQNREARGKERTIRVHLRADTLIRTEDARVVPILRPECLAPPVLLCNKDAGEGEELEPGAVFRFICPWLLHVTEGTFLNTMAEQLKNTALFQEKWLEMSPFRPFLSLESSMIDWEQSLVFGHQTHPFHRLCWAIPPNKPVLPENIPSMLTPSLVFISIPRTDLRVSGPFESTLQPLLEKLSISKPEDPNVMVVPCLAQQLPSIRQRFPNASVHTEVPPIATAQASMRTVSINPELDFSYHMKLSLACQITSAVRTITPWTTGQGHFISELLEQVLPTDLWIFREVAAVAGFQDDFNAAKHLSCVLREDLEPRARANNETLIVAAALMEPHPADGKTYPERLFGLDSVEERKKWFRIYIRRLLALTLHPLVYHGIALEAHAQNIVVRLDKSSGEIKGFAIRDFGGVKFHKPTLAAQGFNLDWEIEGSLTLTEKLDSVWNIASHTLLQCHAPSLLYGLRLESHGGWAVVQEELLDVLAELDRSNEIARRLVGYFCDETVVMKSFLQMLIQGVYRSNIEFRVPNPLVQSA